MPTRRSAASAALLTALGLAIPTVAHAGTSGTVIYVANPTSQCTSETGNNGSAAKPYCAIQDAVNAAASGDTISIAPDGVYYGAITVTTSNLSFVGSGAEVELNDPVSLDKVTGISLSGLVFMDQVHVVGSSGIRVDSDLFTGANSIGAVTVDGASSNVTVSRSIINAQGSNGTAILVASGASGVDIASNAFAPFNNGAVSANGVSGLDVVGNTIQRGCGGGIVVSGATTNSYIENNVLEDANTDVDVAWIGGLKSSCTTWSPDINVDSTAAGGTTSDYNDFYSWGSDNTAAYSWAGATYQTPSAFAAAVAHQGAHDTVDTVESAAITANPMGWGDKIQAALEPGSAAIGSANGSAPGALSTDLYGLSPYTDRGAVADVADNVKVSATVTPVVYDNISQALTLQVDPTGSGTFPIANYDVAWGDGATTSQGYMATHTYAQAGTYSVVVTAVDTHGRTASTTVKATVAGSDYTPYGPVRLLDTRIGTGAAAHAVAPRGVLKLKVTGAGSVANPIPLGITAVVLNVTVVSPSQAGVLTVYPDETATGAGQSAPSTSNLNFVAKQLVPNLVTTTVGPNGVVDLFNNSSGSTQLVADVVGYYRQQAGSQYVSLVPQRILDTRTGAGAGIKEVVPAGGSVTFSVQYLGQLADPNDVPTVTAVAMNLTAVNGSAGGFLTAYPAGEPLPNASNVNYPAHQDIANMTIVPVGTNNDITIHNSSTGTVELVADADGYFTTTRGFAAGTYTASEFEPSAYLPMATPYRWLDTRTGYGPLVGGTSTTYPFTDDPFVDGVVMNATVAEPTASGFLTVFPGDATSGVPNASNINFLSGHDTPNMVIVSPGTFADPGGKHYIGAYLSGKGKANLVADVFGLFEYE